MSVSVSAAAYRLCDAMNWSLSQLSVQKGLYLAHMIHLGDNDGAPLVSEAFEAWEYGPVLPSLYQDLKMFGRKPIKNIFWTNKAEDGSSEALAIDSLASQIKGLSAARLVHITHNPQGAWAKHYSAAKKGVVIPNTDILAEYEWRSKEAA